MKRIIFLFFLLSQLASFSQKELPFSIVERNHYGIVIAHHAFLDSLINRNFTMLQIDLDKKNYGEKPCEKKYGAENSCT